MRLHRAALCLLALSVLVTSTAFQPTPPPPPELPPAQRYDAEVDASQLWQSTAITVTEGETLAFSVVGGEWTHWQGEAPNNMGTGGDYICGAETCAEPLPSAPQGQLIGRIGAQIFPIGQHNAIIASESGPLELSINDDPNGLGDNAGRLFLHVSVSPVSYGSALSLPSYFGTYTWQADGRTFELFLTFDNAETLSEALSEGGLIIGSVSGRLYWPDFETTTIYEGDSELFFDENSIPEPFLALLESASLTLSASSGPIFTEDNRLSETYRPFIGFLSFRETRFLVGEGVELGTRFYGFYFLEGLYLAHYLVNEDGTETQIGSATLQIIR